MTKNVANIVVTKQKRRTVVATRLVVSEDVHLSSAHLTLTQSRTRKGLLEQRHVQAKLESCAENVRLQTETEPYTKERSDQVLRQSTRTNVS